MEKRLQRIGPITLLENAAGLGESDLSVRCKYRAIGFRSDRF